MDRRQGLIKGIVVGLLLAAGMAGATCIENPAAGVCCAQVPCDGGRGWANLETKAPSGGPVVSINTPYTVQAVKLAEMKRLGLPADAPAQPEHLAYFEPTGRVKGGNGAPFSGVTEFGPVAGKVNGFRWYAVSALKDPAGVPPDTATALHEYGCYFLGNAGTGRITATWEDQFGNQSGSFSYALVTLCLPANGKPGPGFVCYGDSDNVGPGPGQVGVDTPVTSPAWIETQRYDEFCAVLR